MTPDEMILSEEEQKIYKVVEIFNRPVTLREVAEELGISLPLAKRIIDNLVKKGNLVVLKPQMGRTLFYSVVGSKDGLDAVLSQKYTDLIAPIERQFEELQKKNKNLEVKIEKLYANIITLMGIFVAIFALIVINVNAVGEYLSKLGNSSNVFGTLLLVNTPLVLSLVVLVLLIKFLLWHPSGRCKKDLEKGE